MGLRPEEEAMRYGILVSLTVLCAVGFEARADAQESVNFDLTPYYNNANDPTTRWLLGMNPWEYARRGADFAAARNQPGRLGVTLVNVAYDFDFDLIANTEMRLHGVNRIRALQAVFAAVTAGARNDTERHLQLLQWLQQVSFHDGWMQLVYPSTDPEYPLTAVHDPLVLLEIGSMRCGHVSRLAVDLWEAAGYETRGVQLAGHVVAEVYYDGGWHYLDADIFSGGETVLLGGQIPSIGELSRQPLAVDRLFAFAELDSEGLPAFWDSIRPSGSVRVSPYYPSYFYFSQRATGDPERTTIWYYVKNPGAPANRLYGWDSYATVDSGIPFQAGISLHYAPHAPEIISINKQVRTGVDCVYSIDWQDVTTPGLVGYRVYSSTVTRGWSYNKFLGTQQAAQYASDRRGWVPSMYPKLTQEPPGHSGTVANSEVSLIVPIDSMVYVTLAGYDSHGQLVGREKYPLSSEVLLACP